MLALRGPVLCVPLIAFVPLQPPEAAQEVVSVDDHVRVAAAPEARVVGVAVSVTLGGWMTPTGEAARSLVPPLPLAGVTATPPHAASIKDDAIAATRTAFFRKVR